MALMDFDELAIFDFYGRCTCLSMGGEKKNVKHAFKKFQFQDIWFKW